MGAAWYRGWREVRRRWPAIVAVSAIVGLAGGVTMAAVAGARRTTSSFDRFRVATDASDAFLQATGIQEDVVRRALAAPQVARWSRFSLYLGSVPGIDEELVIYAGHDARLGEELERPRVLEGRLPDERSATEVVVSEAAAERTGVGVGGTLRAATVAPAQMADLEEAFSGEFGGPSLALDVVGIVRTPDDFLAADDLSVMAPPAFERRHRGSVGHFDGFYAVDLRRDHADVAAFQAAVSATMPAGEEWGVEGAEEAATVVRDALRVLSTGLVVFAAVAALAGAVAGGQAVARQLAPRADDEVALAAMGMTRRDRGVSLAVPGLAMAAGGAALAVAVAVAASPLLPIGLARRVEPSPGVDADLPVLFAGAALVVTIVTVSTLASAWVAARPTVARARSTRPSSVAPVLSRAGLGPVAMTGVRMAFEPGRGRSRLPVRTALLGTVVGVLGVVATLTFAASLDRLVASPARWGWNWDLVPDSSPEEQARLARDPDVAELGVVHHAFVLAEGHDVQGFAVEPLKGTPSLGLLDGRLPSDPTEVVLGRELLRDLDREIGDEVTLARGFGAEGEPLRYTIVGTALFPTFETEGFAGSVGFTPAGLQPVQLSDGSARTILALRPGVSDDAALDRLSEEYPRRFGRFSRPDLPADVTNLAEVDRLPHLLAAFLAVLAAVGVAHAVVAAARRRRRDLAVLRVLGFRRRQTLAAIAWQASALVVLGIAVGVPLGLAVGRWAWAVVARSLGVLEDAALPVATLVLLPVAALLAANAIAAVPARWAVRVPPGPALRTE
jgi:hypothetical protein